jgi:hypothetical protein
MFPKEKHLIDIEALTDLQITFLSSTSSVQSLKYAYVIDILLTHNSSLNWIAHLMQLLMKSLRIWNILNKPLKASLFL